MFDIQNKEYISNVIKSRSASQYIIPLYVKLYNDTYSILELSDMTDYNPASFKVGFGSSASLFDKKPFPTQYAFDVDTQSTFILHDDTLNSDIRYLVFESSDVDPSTSEFHSQIHEYFMMISQFVNGIVSERKKEVLKQLMEENS